MALVLNQVVEVRVAVVLQASDLSVGQVWDGSAWGDLAWIDLAGSTVLPLELGNAHFVGEVSSLALTRSSVTRPAVRLRAWVSGGTVPTAFRILTSGSTTANQATPLAGGADLATDLPALGPVANVVRIRGFRDQRVGWTGRLPSALSWDRSTLALRKRVKFQSSDFYDNQLIVGVAGFAGDLAGFNAWLAANRPEFGSPITLGAMVAVHQDRDLYGTIYRYHTVGAFTLHFTLGPDYATWWWDARSAAVRPLTVETSSSYLCAGLTSSRLLSGESFVPTAVNAASSLVGTPLSATIKGSLPTPAASGGTVTASPRALLYSSGPTYGLDATLTIDAEGHITGVSLAGYGSGCTVLAHGAWGACKTEGGFLA